MRSNPIPVVRELDQEEKKLLSKQIQVSAAQLNELKSDKFCTIPFLSDRKRERTIILLYRR